METNGLVRWVSATLQGLHPMIEESRAHEYLTSVSYLYPMARIEWLYVLRDAYDVNVDLLTVDQDEIMTGVMPIYESKSGAKYSLKFGLVSEDEFSQSTLSGNFDSLCRRDKSLGLLHSGPNILDLTSSRRRCSQTFRIRTVDNLDELKGKTRNLVRKAIRSGVTVESDRGYIHDFYNLYGTVGKYRHKHSLDFFLSLLSHFPDAKVLASKYRGVVIGAMILVFAKNIAVYPFHVSAPQYHQFSPNALLIWQAIQECNDKGVEILDMGESSFDSGSYRFKQNFGASPFAVNYYHVDRRSLLSRIFGTKSPSKEYSRIL